MTTIDWSQDIVKRCAEVVKDSGCRFQIVHIKAEDRLWLIPFVKDRWAARSLMQDPGRFGVFPFRFGHEQEDFHQWVTNYLAAHR